MSDSGARAPKPPLGPPPSFAPRVRPFGQTFAPAVPEGLPFQMQGRAPAGGLGGMAARPPSGMPPAGLVLPRGGMALMPRPPVGRPPLAAMMLGRPTMVSSVVPLPPIAVSGFNSPGFGAPSPAPGMTLPGQYGNSERASAPVVGVSSKTLEPYRYVVRQGTSKTPFGVLKLSIQGCKGLTRSAAEASATSSVRVRIGERVATTGVAKEGGARPRYGDELTFDIFSDREATIEVVSKQLISGGESIDVVMATARTSIMPWVARGRFTGDVELRDTALQPCGTVQLSTLYTANESASKSPTNESLGPGGVTEGVKAAAPGSGTGTGSTSSAPTPICPFTDAEIKEAFAAFDLDKNNFIGAAEIRHILTSIGESVSDEEVDEMIRMVDRDGDGQVSYAEFYRMVTGGAIPTAAAVREQREAGGGSGVGVGASTRQVEGGTGGVADTATLLQARNARKQAMETFVRLHALTMATVQNAWAQFQVRDKLGERMIEYSLMCELLDVEPTPDVEALYKLLDVGKRGAIHFGEMVVSLCNCVAVMKEERTRFVFHVFDTNKDDSINKAELVHILKGNHMAWQDSEVSRKAETIMETADSDKDGFITYDEFVRVAERFPKILFPSSGGK